MGIADPSLSEMSWGGTTLCILSQCLGVLGVGVADPSLFEMFWGGTTFCVPSLYFGVLCRLDQPLGQTLLSPLEWG